MRADELVVLTRAEYDALVAQTQQANDFGELFNAEEMQAIRDQYEERFAVEQERREELEWKVRMELAKIRDAELHARRAADEIRRVELTLQAMLVEGEDTQVRSVGPSATLTPVAPKPQVVLRNVPPPIPAPRNGSNGGNGSHGGGSNGNGQSHADKFRAAMAQRKSYVA
ncbi:MAG: hypothetical protein JWN44_2466 [Myxococcales bacterium]|nr:hypothetical protein [Myxococcales bacterium]